jgi:hypothetical protein
MTIVAAIVDRAAGEPRGDCGGPIYRGDYACKPRGALLRAEVESVELTGVGFFVHTGVSEGG